jgi:Transposase DDE domain
VEDNLLVISIEKERRSSMNHHSASTQEETMSAPAEQILTFLQALLSTVPPDPQALPVKRKRGHPVVVSYDHLWLAMLTAILRGFTGFASVWRLITWSGVGSFPLVAMTRDGVRKRLLHASLDSLQELLTRVSAALLAWTSSFQDRTLAPFATAILALDQSTLDAVQRRCQDVREEAKDSPILRVGKLAGLFDLRRQQWVRLLFRDDVFVNEKHLVEELFAGVQVGTLVLADLGYFSFPWFDWLGDQGCWWISRLREKTSHTTEHCFYRRGTTIDALVWLGAYRSDRSKYLVRLIQFEYRGLSYRYLTNVCDPTLLSMSEVARLYARRWDIELAFKALKGDLGIHLWWSSHPKLVLQQLFCAMIVAQILHALHLRVAFEAGVDLFDVSLPVLVRLLAMAPARLMGEGLLPLLVRKGRKQGLIRPSRRYQAVVPALLEAYIPLPADLVMTRIPHHAQRKCKARSDCTCFEPRFFSFFLI